MITIEDMIQREVLCCMSSLVSTLAKGSGLPMSAEHLSRETRADLGRLFEQAAELAAPVLDYEEAAIQGGWSCSGPFDGYFHYRKTRHQAVFKTDDGAWREICDYDGIDPVDREVYEHWAVSTWFAEKLIAQGERVDTDFAGLNIWARTTTEQAISMDGVVQKICREMVK